MIKVFSVCTPGGAYNASHVERLAGMLLEHLPLEYEFIVLIDRRWPDLKPWWEKVNLFDPTLAEPGTQCLYLDLDVTLIRDISPIALFPAQPGIIADYLNPLRYNSSVMVWKAGNPDLEKIYTEFTPGRAVGYHGDQDYIWDVSAPAWSPLHRAWCQSFKVDLKSGEKEPHPDCRVIVYHGQPKPWSLGEDND